MIYLVTGLPRSGKGTFCKDKKRDRTHINLDTIRKVLSNKGLYKYPYQHDAEHIVVGLAAATVAQLFLDGAAHIYVDDYALLYTQSLQEEFMQAVSENAGMEVNYEVHRVDTHPAVCLSRLKEHDMYLAPIIVTQAIKDLQAVTGQLATKPDTPELFPVVETSMLMDRLYEASKEWQDTHRADMNKLDPHA